MNELSKAPLPNNNLSVQLFNCYVLLWLCKLVCSIVLLLVLLKIEDSGIAPGAAHTESGCLPFRLGSDLTLVAHNKKLVPLCELLRALASEHGIGDISMEDHVLKHKTTGSVP